MLLSSLRFASVSVAVFAAIQWTLTAADQNTPQPTAPTPQPTAPAWSSGFAGRGAPLPPPCASCQVCFYENPGFKGDKFCVGRRTQSLQDFLVINAPSTIGSIKFTASPGSQCDLVVNLRVLDPPYGRHFESYSRDVNDTQYDNVVQQVYVETAGRACFSAALEIDDYGQCYNESVRRVNGTYRNSFYEALLFESDRKLFDVVVYDEDEYKGLSKRLHESTSDLNVLGSNAEVAPDTLQMRIRSIQFVPVGGSHA